MAALFPAHEIEPFTEHFFGLIQDWRRDEEGAKRAGAASAAKR